MQAGIAACVLTLLAFQLWWPTHFASHHAGRQADRSAKRGVE